MATFVFDGGNLKIFVTFGVDVLEKSDLTSNCDVLISFYLGDVLMVAKINIAIRKMIEKVLGAVNFKFVKFLKGFGTDAG